MRVIEYLVDTIDNGKTVRDYLKRRGYSSGIITMLKKYSDAILVNDMPVFTTVVLKTGDLLRIKVSDNASDIAPQKLDYSVAYEDDDILVYDKPAGVVVHPTKVYQSETLGNDYAYRCSIKGEECTFRPVYRIDRNTSGLVLIAKNRLAACVDVSKKYICVCNGIVPEAGIFNSPIALSADSKIKREVNLNGQAAVTNFKRISVGNEFSVCEVWLETGRTHQIRVHFSNAGYPLVGDSLYGDSDEIMSRHALHCSQIDFTNPITGKVVRLCSDLPKDMSNFIFNNIS